MDKLSSYPYVEVRVRCAYCRREGQYRLARLAEKFGAEIELEDLLDRIAFDCAYRIGKIERMRTNKRPCGAYYPDLIDPPRPPDMPVMIQPLKLVAGGKK